MPKVLRIINRLNLGGPTYNAAFLSKFLAPEFETMLVAGIKEETEESSEFIVQNMGLSPVYIPEMHREINFRNDRMAYKKIKNLIREFKPDIVHTHAAKAGTLGRLAARSMNVPVVLHTFHGHVFHSYFSPVKTFVFKQIERYLSTISTRIIAISKTQKMELCEVHRICNASKISVIPLGFDLSRFRTGQEQLNKKFRLEYGIPEDTLIVSIIGRIVPVKNHTLFVKAFDLARKNFSGKVVGVIVGDGDDMNDIQHLAISLGMKISTPGSPSTNADLIFTSWILDVERPLAASDVVAMTSLNEGTPVSLIEAQAAGKPIVTTNVGGIGDVVMSEETALLSPANHPEPFAQNLLKLLNNKDLRTNMEQKGWEFVKSRFMYTRLVEDTRKLYNDLLDGNRLNFK